MKVDKTLGEVKAQDYDAIVLPGGQINPDYLRVNQQAIAFIKDFYSAGKVVAAVCHAPWLLIEAGIVKGHRATSYKSIKTDVINAGGQWVDEQVVTDRRPDRQPAALGPGGFLRQDRRGGRRRQARAALRVVRAYRAANGADENHRARHGAAIHPKPAAAFHLWLAARRRAVLQGRGEVASCWKIPRSSSRGGRTPAWRRSGLLRFARQ